MPGSLARLAVTGLSDKSDDGVKKNPGTVAGVWLGCVMLV
jgi:hypothetical protein